MKQILNIFQKDVQHLRIVIAIAQLALLAFTLHAPIEWAVPSYVNRETRVFISYALVALMGIAWSILVFRLVQSERLVGANQFWTTRPYEWPKLLMAKLLFLAA